MSRAQRLLDLIQLLRGYRRPVSGAVLAEALGISLRTFYRGIETLNAQGAHVDGEAVFRGPCERPHVMAAMIAHATFFRFGPRFGPARYWASLSSAMVVLAAASSSGKKSIGPGLS
jgi:biotin operon repressor